MPGVRTIDPRKLSREGLLTDIGLAELPHKGSEKSSSSSSSLSDVDDIRRHPAMEEPPSSLPTVRFLDVPMLWKCSGKNRGPFTFPPPSCIASPQSLAEHTLQTGEGHIQTAVDRVNKTVSATIPWIAKPLTLHMAMIPTLLGMIVISILTIVFFHQEDIVGMLICILAGSATLLFTILVYVQRALVWVKSFGVASVLVEEALQDINQEFRRMAHSTGNHVQFTFLRYADAGIGKREMIEPVARREQADITFRFMMALFSRFPIYFLRITEMSYSWAQKVLSTKKTIPVADAPFFYGRVAMASRIAA